MARFEKERDPVEIQERLSLSSRSSIEDEAFRSNGRLKEKSACSNGGHRYTPYNKSPPAPTDHNSKSLLSAEKTMKSSPGHKVFIANLAFTSTEKIVENHMARVGSVVKVLLFKNPNGSSKGMGIVQYRNEDSVQRAINELRDSELDNRRVYIRKHMEEDEREKCGIITINRPIDRPRPPANPSATVFINNLDYSCTWQQIKDVFKAAGKIVYCEVQLDKEGRSKGMASVQYERPIEALNAIALFHGQVLFNRALMVRMDNRSSIKPDSMTVKHVLGGGLNQSAALALLGGVGGGMTGMGMNLLGLSASLGLSPDLLKSLGVSSSSNTCIDSVMGGMAEANGGYYPYSDEGGSPSRSRHAPPLLPSPSIPLLNSPLLRIHQSPNGADGLLGSAEFDAVPSVGVATPPINDTLPQTDRHFLYTKQPTSKGRRIVIKNLNFKTPWQRLKDLFKGAGKVQFVDIMQGPDGRPNGTAFVLFDKPEEAAKAIELFHNSELDGRKIDVQLDRMDQCH